jgi:glycosyltransferase involved in cell wall biosynthesis
VKIAIVGNYGLQQFPLLSVGGVEAAVESLAWGMHRAGADFLCVVPRRGPRFLPFVRRDRRADYPFEIVETRHGPVGPSRRRAGVISQEAARILASEKPDVIWCQGHWSYPAFLDLGVPIISSFQDSHEKRPGWMMRHDNLFFRFVSRYQYDLWVVEDWERARSFQVYYGMVDEDYDLGADRADHFLWVATLGWGWTRKGLDIFVELARRNSRHRFVAYGAGDRKIEARLREIDRELPNFEFGGELRRGAPHRDAFKRAKALVMPTQIMEALGRTVLESLTKGTPVIGSANGALPELVAEGCGVTSNDFGVLEGALDTSFDHRRCFEYSKRFLVAHEVHEMLRASERILSSGSLEP